MDESSGKTNIRRSGNSPVSIPERVGGGSGGALGSLGLLLGLAPPNCCTLIPGPPFMLKTNPGPPGPSPNSPPPVLPLASTPS